jgi:phosphoribosyl-ATP pyrophosphohydrolase/phosphoribosyl-AMP cyclohydrolase
MKINFEKGNGLIPVIIQDDTTLQVLMLGFMNEEAYKETLRTKKVTFFSRSKNRLWIKGESSNNFLNVVDIKIDCDSDTLLILAKPDGPTCHTGKFSCFGESVHKGFIYTLQEIIQNRKDNPKEGSYTNLLFDKGTAKCAQKVGEEAVELVIEAMRNKDKLFLNEAADLIFHLLILLNIKGYLIEDIEKTLKGRAS